MAEINVPVERYQELLTLAVKLFCRLRTKHMTNGDEAILLEFNEWLAEQTEVECENK